MHNILLMLCMNHLSIIYRCIITCIIDVSLILKYNILPKSNSPAHQMQHTTLITNNCISFTTFKEFTKKILLIIKKYFIICREYLIRNTSYRLKIKAKIDLKSKTILAFSSLHSILAWLFSTAYFIECVNFNYLRDNDNEITLF